MIDQVAKTVRDNFSIVTLCVIALAYFDTYSYYVLFGVSIFQYQEVSEIVFSLSSLFAILLGSFLMAIPNVISSHRVTNFGHFISKFDDLQSEERLRERQKFVRNKFIGCLVVFLFVTTIVITILTSTDATNITERQYFLIGICCLFMLGILFRTLSFRLALTPFNVDYSAKEISERVQAELAGDGRRIMTYFVIFLVLAISYKVKIRYQNIITGNPTHIISFRNDDRKFTSSTSYFYIGSTKNYVFMYDSIRKETDIYPERDITLTSIKRIREGL